MMRATGTKKQHKKAKDDSGSKQAHTKSPGPGGDYSGELAVNVDFDNSGTASNDNPILRSLCSSRSPTPPPQSIPAPPPSHVPDLGLNGGISTIITANQSAGPTSDQIRRYDSEENPQLLPDPNQNDALYYRMTRYKVENAGVAVTRVVIHPHFMTVHYLEMPAVALLKKTGLEKSVEVGARKMKTRDLDSDRTRDHYTFTLCKITGSLASMKVQSSNPHRRQYLKKQNGFGWHAMPVATARGHYLAQTLMSKHLKFNDEDTEQDIVELPNSPESTNSCHRIGLSVTAKPTKNYISYKTLLTSTLSMLMTLTVILFHRGCANKHWKMP
ncbi:hypothetical protein EV401DRAFT_1886531 [Pisolithus croceorrhizus]|nr:hypothetical protein EV401DRAFT_1886531 [Pisolithus croceorrhizus]